MLVPAVLKVTVKYFFPRADSMAQARDGMEPSGTEFESCGANSPYVSNGIEVRRKRNKLLRGQL
jgi:hypothetical protein